jgi:hypothetical protein
MDATLTPAGHEQISILDTIHDVLRVDEQLSAPALHYRATNHYWVDPRDGFIWKSEQQVAPGLALQLVVRLGRDVGSGGLHLWLATHRQLHCADRRARQLAAAMQARQQQRPHEQQAAPHRHPAIGR